MAEMGSERFNLAAWLLDRNVDEGRGDHPAVRYKDRILTYAEVSETASRCGNALRELGVGNEDRVLLILPDCPEFVYGWMATLKIGGVFAMANTIHTAEDYAYYLDYTRAPVAVVHESVFDRILEVVPGAKYLKSILLVSEDAGGTDPRVAALDRAVLGGFPPPHAAPEAPDAGHPARSSPLRAAPGAPDGGHPAGSPPPHAAPEAPGACHPAGFSPLLAVPGAPWRPALSGGAGKIRIELFAPFVARQDARLEQAQTGPDDLAGWLFTSGTTGRPKAAVHMHQDFRFNIEHYAKQIVGYRPSDITLSVPKLFFGYATGTNLMFPFAFGGQTALFSERSTAETLFAMIERHRPTVLTSVPTMINAMLQAEGAPRRDLSSVRVCLSAGEALPAELYRRWKKTFGVEILDGIGSAEMFHIYISSRFGAVTPGSLGQVVPGYEARVVGADEHEVPPGETGTLWIKGASRALCYWGSREASQKTFRGEWCVTGDQFRADASGFYWYEGRTDDMLKVGGIFVSPLEIEDCLLAHDAVREVCVVGAADETGLTKPKAFVVAKEASRAGPALAEELKAFVKSRLAPYKYPRWIEFMDVLPRSDRGKIQRSLLRHGTDQSC